MEPVFGRLSSRKGRLRPPFLLPGAMHKKVVFQRDRRNQMPQCSVSLVSCHTIALSLPTAPANGIQSSKPPSVLRATLAQALWMSALDALSHMSIPSWKLPHRKIPGRARSKRPEQIPLSQPILCGGVRSGFGPSRSRVSPPPILVLPLGPSPNISRPSSSRELCVSSERTTAQLTCGRMKSRV